MYLNNKVWAMRTSLPLIMGFVTYNSRLKGSGIWSSQKTYDKSRKKESNDAIIIYILLTNSRPRRYAATILQINSSRERDIYQT